MYSGGFYPFETMEIYWAWWSRQILVNRYKVSVGKPYADLLKLVKDKDYFVITTNVDHQFQMAGFEKKRLFYTQGDYGLFQCSDGCHQVTYDNEDIIYEMMKKQVKMEVPTELIPSCPVCGKPMAPNLRADSTFVQDEGWYAANERYNDFIRKHKNLHILYLELGIGNNTPSIIKYPFWDMTSKNKKAVYASVNFDEAFCPENIREHSILINADIKSVLDEVVSDNNK